MSDNNGTALATLPSETQSIARPEARDAFMPIMGKDDVLKRKLALMEFRREVLIEGTDFGSIPGTGDKPTLLKPGAEKLCTLFGLTPRPVVVEKIEDWTGKNHDGEPFFYYWYRYQLWRGDILIAEADGSCNSRESKYRYRWVGESEVPAHLDRSRLKTRGGRISEFDFSVEKSETSGKYGKPADYWQRFHDAIANGTAQRIKKKTAAGKEFNAWEMDATIYRVPNEDIADVVNTLQKMAQKRALVAVTLIGVNASEFFTQDVEDFAHSDGPITDGPVVDALPTEPEPQASPGRDSQPDLPPIADAETLKRCENLRKRAVELGLKTKSGGIPEPLETGAPLDLAERLIKTYAGFVNKHTKAPPVTTEATPETTEATDQPVEGEIIEPPLAGVLGAVAQTPEYAHFVAACAAKGLRWESDTDLQAFEQAMGEFAGTIYIALEATASDWEENAGLVEEGTLKW